MMKSSEKKENNRNEQGSVKKIFDDFANSTTAHGIQHLVSSKKTLGKAVWLIVCLAALTTNLFLCAQLVKKYLSKPVSTTVGVRHEQTMIFPSVMVCNHNMLRKSEFQKAKRRKLINFKQDASMMSLYKEMMLKAIGMANQASNTSSMNISVNTDIIERRCLLEYLSNIEKPQLKGLGHQFHNFVVRCDWKGIDCKSGMLENRWYKVWNHIYGNCFIFNYGYNMERKKQEPLRLEDVGMQNGLTLDLNIELYEYDEELTKETGVRVLLADQGVFPLPSIQGFSVPPGVHASIGIKKVEAVRVDPFNNGSCRRSDSLDEDGDKYTMQRCTQRCHWQRQLKKCNCTGLRLSSPNRTCLTVEEHMCKAEVSTEMDALGINKICSTKCPPPCFEAKFSHSVTYSTLYTAALPSSATQIKLLSTNDILIQHPSTAAHPRLNVTTTITRLNVMTTMTSPNVPTTIT
eukprot:gene2732-950_t